jgi:translation initiation factor IF-3
MRRYYKFGKKPQKQRVKYPINEGIKALEVNVIDETGKPLGIMPTAKAISEAAERGFDLIAVSPKAVPPVVKFADYGKLQYQQEKLLKKQKTLQKRADIKGIRLSAKISDHDAELKRNQANKFLEKGHKVKIEVIVRGREHNHLPMIKEMILKFINNLSVEHIIEQDLSKQGSKLSAVVAPKS